MKKAIWLLLGTVLLGVTGCGNAEVDQSFSVSASEQEAYINEIDALLDEYYWIYDSDSVVFRSGTVPQDTAESARLFHASQDLGYPLKSSAGSESVIVEADLLHYNGDSAGELNCIFINNQLSGVYYIGGYDQEAYSLRERNPFLANGSFQGFENWSGMATDTYRKLRGTLPLEGFVAKSRTGIVASIQNGAIEMYCLSGNYLSRMLTLKPEAGLESASATFVEKDWEDLTAVLLTGVTDTHSEVETIEESLEKVVIYNSSFGIVGEIPLAGEGHTAVSSDGGKLFVFSDQIMETYELQEGNWVSTKHESLRHKVTQCQIADLDGNGVKEYLMTDGMDLYVYQHLETTGLLKLWSTHLGVESLYGALYSGDLNGDGVKEIYICDATGTAIRYVLTDRGLRSSNEDIQYMEAIYPCDFNGDGIDDYWNVTEETEAAGRTGSLYLSQ